MEAEATVPVCVCVFECSQLFRFTGFIDRTTITELYKCLDVAVFTSTTQYETFGIVNLVRSPLFVWLHGPSAMTAFSHKKWFSPRLCFVGLLPLAHPALCRHPCVVGLEQEAMAMGIPVVHLGVAGMQDYFIDGWNSVLATNWSGDAVARGVLSLLRNDTLRRDLGRNARTFVTRYLASNVTAPAVFADLV